MKKLLLLPVCTLLLNLLATPALAVPIAWTDWQSGAGTSASGQLTIGSTVVDVTLTSTSLLHFVQTGTGPNYFSGHVSNPSGTAYTNGVIDNAPTAGEMIALNAGGTVTLTFSQAIQDIFIAVVSINGNHMDFGTGITIDSYGQGFWGAGTPLLNGTGTGIFGAGEVHGVVKASGDFTSLSFTHTSENWHGFTLGVAELADVPEPAAVFLLLVGMLGLGLRRRQLVV